jgi:hypothetical protein
MCQSTSFIFSRGELGSYRRFLFSIPNNKFHQPNVWNGRPRSGGLVTFVVQWIEWAFGWQGHSLNQGCLLKMWVMGPTWCCQCRDQMRCFELYWVPLKHDKMRKYWGGELFSLKHFLPPDEREEMRNVVQSNCTPHQHISVTPPIRIHSQNPLRVPEPMDFLLQGGTLGSEQRCPQHWAYSQLRERTS